MSETDPSPENKAVTGDYLLDVEMQQYAGQWVAIVRQKIVASGDDLKSVVDEAAAKGYKRPLVMRAPEQGVWIL